MKTMDISSYKIVACAFLFPIEANLLWSYWCNSKVLSMTL